MSFDDEPTPPPITSKEVPLTPEQAKVFADNLGLAHDAVKRALRTPVGRAIGRDDLFSCAVHALGRCIPSFNPALAKFSTYAEMKMSFALKDFGEREARQHTLASAARAAACEEAATFDVDGGNPLEPDHESLASLEGFSQSVLCAQLVALVEHTYPERAQPALVEDALLDKIQAARVRAAFERVAAADPDYRAVLEVVVDRGGTVEDLAARLAVSDRAARRRKEDFYAAVRADLGLAPKRAA